MRDAVDQANARSRLMCPDCDHAQEVARNEQQATLTLVTLGIVSGGTVVGGAGIRAVVEIVRVRAGQDRRSYPSPASARDARAVRPPRDSGVGVSRRQRR